MTVIYRIISFVINLVAFFLTGILLILLPFILLNPASWFSIFITAGVVLYCWFSSKFRKQVLQRREVVSRKLRDWVRVNGFLTVVFAASLFYQIVLLVNDPTPMLEMMKPLGEKYHREVKAEDLYLSLTITMTYSGLLIIHIIWTFLLLQKYKDFFREEQ